MRINRRITAVITAAAGIAGLALAGWASAAPSTDTSKWPPFFQVTGGTGIGIAVGPALVQDLQKKFGMPGTFVQPPGGGAGAAFLQMIIDGKAYVAVGGGDVVPNMAYQGAGYWAGKGPQPIRGLLTMYKMGVTFMARKKSGINSIGDVKGKRVLSWYANVPPHIDTINALLKYHGMTKDDVVAIKQSSINEANEALIAGTADLTTRSCPERGSVGIEELAKQINLKIVPVTRQELDFVIQEVPYISQGVTIKKGTFTGQDEDVLMVAYMQSILVYEGLPDNLVYEIMKIFLDSAGPDTPGEYAKVHPSAAWTLNNAATAVGYVPLHSGAVKYYKDRGVWTQELEKKQQDHLARIK